MSSGDPVTFGTQNAEGRWRDLETLIGGYRGGFPSVAAKDGGRRLRLGFTHAGCDPLDHVDVSMRKEWVLLDAVAINDEICRSRNKARRAQSRTADLRLTEPLRGRPLLEHPPGVANPALLDQRPVRFVDTRISPDGRTIVIYYSYGTCVKLAAIEVTESRRTVKITLSEGHIDSPFPCAGVAIEGLTLVHLQSPLGKRRVIDGAPPSAFR